MILFINPIGTVCGNREGVFDGFYEPIPGTEVINKLDPRIQVVYLVPRIEAVNSMFNMWAVWLKHTEPREKTPISTFSNIPIKFNGSKHLNFLIEHIPISYDIEFFLRTENLKDEKFLILDCEIGEQVDRRYYAYHYKDLILVNPLEGVTEPIINEINQRLCS